MSVPEGDMSVAPSNPAGVRMEDLPEQAWPRQEIIDGSLYGTPLARAGHQDIVMRLCVALLAVVPKDLRVLPGVNILRRTATDRLLIPDVAVVEAEALSGDPLSVRPEDVYLAAEVVSPSSRATDLHLKRELYAEWGIGSYWVLDPEPQEVHRFGLRPVESCWLADVDLAVWPDA
jgi:Uma2 family endonuclease